uniref:Uncharacterized protein n=1 Tax=Arundo donax TaxID=35708 RepID=A0A0A9CBV6_ARUDO
MFCKLISTFWFQLFDNHVHSLHVTNNDSNTLLTEIFNKKKSVSYSIIWAAYIFWVSAGISGYQQNQNS